MPASFSFTFIILNKTTNSSISPTLSLSLSLSHHSNDALDRMSGIGYVVGFIIFITLMNVIRILLSICFGFHFPSSNRHQNGLTTLRPSYQQSEGTTAPRHSINIIELGLDEATLRNYPKLLYAQAKLHNGNSTASCCSICLADYKDTDVLRLLPDCGHRFHLKCVDSWLRLHATCPVCRNSPLSEVAPAVGATSLTS